MQGQRNVNQDHSVEHIERVKGSVVWPRGLSSGRQYPVVPRDHLACETSEVLGRYHVFKVSESIAV